MAKWQDIVQSGKYKSLSNERKMNIKRNFVIKNILPNSQFKNLDVQSRAKVLKTFGESEDGISPVFKTRVVAREKRAIEKSNGNESLLLSLARDAVVETPTGSEAQLTAALVAGFGELFDAPVDFAAKSIETFGGKIKGGVPAGRSNIKLITLDFPRYFAASFLRLFAKPTEIVTATAIGKGLGVVGKLIGKSFKLASKITSAAIGAGIGGVSGAKLDEENRLRGLLIGAAGGAAGGGVLAMQKFRPALRSFFLEYKGAPKKAIEHFKETELSKALGDRESKKVLDILTTAQEDIAITLKGGIAGIKEKGKVFDRATQKFIGRIFRREIDLSGNRPILPESPIPTTNVQRNIERTVGFKPESIPAKIQKSVEVQVAFNPRVKALNKRLKYINGLLGNKRLRAEAQIGKIFRTDTGFIERAVDVTSKSNIVTEPVSPITGGIPADLLNAGEDILRSLSQVSKAPTIEKAAGLERKALLRLKKETSRKLEKELMAIELHSRASYSLFDRKFAEQIRNNPKFKILSGIAQQGRDIMDKWSKELIKSGVPSKQAIKIIEGHVGEYMARTFEANLSKNSSSFNAVKAYRLRLNGLKKRKDLTAETLRLLGEIKEPGIPTSLRVGEISQTVANAKLFKNIASNPEWTSTANVTGDLIKMADDKALGDLRGKWVIRSIAENINDIMFKQPNWIKEIYSNSLGAFKFGKVVLNPATHMRNIVVNTMLLEAGGVNHARQLELLPKVMKDYINKGSLYQKALETGAIGGEFIGGDVEIMMEYYLAKEGSHMAKMSNMLKMPFKKAGDIYQAEEQLSKMMMFVHILEKTGDAKLAAKEAQKWLFNYKEIPDAIKFAKHISPFVTFTYKSIPRMVETAVKNPILLHKYSAFINGFNQASANVQDMTPAEYARELGALPPWQIRAIGGIPMNLLLPIRTTPTKDFKRGRAQWINLEYNMPLGMAPEIVDRGIGDGGVGDVLLTIVGNPYFSLLADLSKNKDFRNRDIIPVGATKAEAIQAEISHAYQLLMPSLAPNVLGLKGGYSWEKLWEAVSKKKVKFSKDTVKRELTPTMLDIFAGLKVTFVDARRSENFKLQQLKRDLGSLEKQEFSAMMDVNLPKEKRAVLINRFYRKKLKIVKEIEKVFKLRQEK